MTASLKYLSISLAAVASLLAAGCSDSVTPAVSDVPAVIATAPAQTVTAKTAFGPLYKDAIAWSSDIEPMGMQPKELAGFKNAAGKAAIWEASFASPSKHQYRVYTYAVATALPDVRKGLSASLPMTWGGATRDAMPIDISSFTVDSDTAYQAASADAGAWLKKNPDKLLASIDLGSNYRFQTPIWYVQWGDKKSGYAAYIDAASGKVYKGK